MRIKSLTLPVILVLFFLILAACSTPTPEVVEVEKEVTKEVKVLETVIVEGTPQVIEKEVTKVVETVVTATPEPVEKGGGTFVGSYYITITSIDPHRAVEFSDNTVNPLVFESLVGFGADGEWKGVLAESWDVSEDGLTWTFHLREGVKFHNGREMTADDVIFSFDRILNETTGASMTSYFANKIESYEALDPATVQFKLTGGAGTFLSELGLSIRSAIIAPECVTKDNTIVHPIGTGPFEFLWWKPGEEWRAKRFDDYWGQVASVDEVVFKYIPDNTIRLTALKTGEIDWMREIPYDQVIEFQQEPPEGVEMSVEFESRTNRLNMNNTRPPFDNPLVRQAVAYAIDKEAYVEAVWFGVGNPHNQPFAPGSFLELPVEDIYRTSDLEKAKELMIEAGYPDGVDVNIISHAPFKDDWEFLDTYLSQIGLRLNVEILDSAQWTKLAKELDYDMILASQALIYHWDRTYSYFDANSSANWLVGGYSNDTVSELLAQGRNEADLIKAKGLYTE
ncbi:MAG: ABC transporter substrate-binding protein, partial [Anaerolineales bacterium]|nr:ABC transporter substrate-binding protein [Anaerolineales bacterium]